MGGGELVMLSEIERNVGRELPLALFDVTHPHNRFCILASETECLKPLIEHILSSVMQIWTLKNYFLLHVTL